MFNNRHLAAVQRGQRPDAKHHYYHYSALPDQNHVRIINILPGIIYEEVHCEITTEYFGDIPDTYEAISYAWGDSGHHTSIICNGKILNVNTSLVDALKRLRRNEETRRVWADAICINQHDDFEKSHQVKRMGKIYESAKAVLAWLGKDTEHYAKDCFDLVQTTVDHLVRHSDNSQNVVDWDIENLQFINTDKTRWEIIIELTDLQWFQRLWVVQEASLAKLCVLIWGDHEMRYDSLIELSLWSAYRGQVSSILGHWASLRLNLLAETFVEAQCTYRLLTRANDRPQIYHLMEETSKREPIFRDVLESCREKKASNPRDYIYAFLGNPLAQLNTEGEIKLIIDPDYKKTVDQVFHDFACNMMQIPREATILLSSVQHNQREEFIHRSGPSWVPYWNKRRLQGRLVTASVGHNAGGPHFQDLRLKIPEHNRSLLQMSGFKFDTLKWVTPIIHAKDLKIDPSRWRNNNRRKVDARGLPFVDRLYQELCDAAGYDVEKNKSFSMTLVQGWVGKVAEIPLHEQSYMAYLGSVRKVAMQLHREAKFHFEAADMADSCDNDIDPIGSISFENGTTCCNNRTLGITHGGRIGIFPTLSIANDISVLVPGCKTPYILRKSESGRHNLIGDCYIHGVMQGELIEELCGNHVKEEDFLVE
jgi:hypothetical protein